MITETKKTYIQYASNLNLGDLTRVKIGPERKALIDNIANRYCTATDSGDEVERSSCISALMLLFWGEIGKIMDKCRGVEGFEADDAADKLYDCIDVACQYRAWQKENSKLSAEQCIRSVIASRGAAAVLYESNLDKHKANNNALKLDDYTTDDNESRFVDTLESDDDATVDANNYTVRKMIQDNFIDKGKIIEGIVLENIAFGDVLKDNKEYVKYTDAEGNEVRVAKTSQQFWPLRLVQILMNLPADYATYFLDKYNVKQEILQAALTTIHTSSNSKLYKSVQNTLEAAKKVLPEA